MVVPTITNSNLYSQSFNRVKSFLKVNITDPRGRYKKDWIHSSMPNVNAKGFYGYPFIVLKLDVAEENKTFDVNTSNKTFRVLMQIYSDESTEIDSIADQIAGLFKSETTLTDFKSREISSSPMRWMMDQNGKKILSRDFGLIMRVRI